MLFTMRAFQTFMISISSLMLSFIPFVYLYAGGSTIGIIVLVGVVTLVVLAFRDFWNVIGITKKSIFEPMKDKDMAEKARRRVSNLNGIKNLDFSYKKMSGSTESSNGKHESFDKNDIASVA